MDVLDAMTGKTLKELNLSNFIPIGTEISSLLPEDRMDKMPASLNDLPHAITRGYDLTINRAAELSIPFAGSISGKQNKRVVVLERTAYKIFSFKSEKRHYGYAIRLCLTVHKWDVNLKPNFSFLAAAAELGQIKAEWTMQVMGLTGVKIDEVAMAPRELNVETFVLAKQSLEKLIKAVRDESTNFIPTLLLIRRSKDSIESDYRKAIARVYALSGIERGWKLKKTIIELSTQDNETIDLILETYKSQGITDENARPDKETKKWAKNLLNKISISLR